MSGIERTTNRVVIFLGSTCHGAGAERVLEYFLAGATTRKRQICLLSPKSSSVTTFARDLGYAWIPWQTKQNSISENTRAYWRLIHTEGRKPLGDIVHAWHTRGLEWAWALGCYWRIPSSGTLHDDPEHQQFGPIRKRIIRLTAAHLDGVAAVSDAVVKRCQELGWKKPVCTLRNGLPDAPPMPQPDFPSRLRIGFLSTNVLWKGISLIPDLVRNTGDLPLEWKLFGDRTGETAPFLDQLRANPRVHYFGHLPLAEALPHIDILLHLSLTLDPYPTVLLEAARAGIPAIATSVGGSAEIIVDGYTGCLVPPGDRSAVEVAIRRLWGNPENRRSMSEAARLRFETSLRVERMVADYFAFWDRLRSGR